jgi:hypothetical protein
MGSPAWDSGAPEIHRGCSIRRASRAAHSPIHNSAKPHGERRVSGDACVRVFSPMWGASGAAADVRDYLNLMEPS